MLNKELSDFLACCIDQNIFSVGAVSLFKNDGQLIYESSHGSSESRIFDLASLTKALVTVPLAMKYLSGYLDKPISFFSPLLPDCTFTIKEMLLHKSGLKAWCNFYVNQVDSPCLDLVNRRKRIEEVIVRSKPFKEDRTELYSDIGYILCGMIIEQTQGRSLGTLFDEFLRELSLDVDTFTLSYRVSENISTGWCALRQKNLDCGEVHDENAFALGGECGHAGLFGDLLGVRQYLTALRESSYFERIYSQPFWRRADDKSSDVFKDAVGHMGFTGTAFWTNNEATTIFLSNRVQSARINPDFWKIRRQVFSLLSKML